MPLMPIRPPPWCRTFNHQYVLRATLTLGSGHYCRFADHPPVSKRCFPDRGSLCLNFNVFVFLLLTEGSECTLYSVTEDIKHMSKPSDLVQGTLDMLLLKILALEPMNGFAVSQRLKQVSGDILQMSDGSLYPALHKLEQEGWITAEWKTSEYGRRAKYYSLTHLGRRQLEKEADNWGRLSSAISRVIKLKEA
jgi:PadR family transcriptional regulator PadR